MWRLPAFLTSKYTSNTEKAGCFPRPAFLFFVQKLIAIQSQITDGEREPSCRPHAVTVVLCSLPVQSPCGMPGLYRCSDRSPGYASS